MPFARGWYPGAFDTTLHVTLGTLIATLAAFRVLLAYGSSWVEIVLIALGVLVMRLPHFNHMEWNARYTTFHMAAGAIVIVIGIISGLITTIEMKKNPPAH
jgi:cytochrome b561